MSATAYWTDEKGATVLVWSLALLKEPLARQRHNDTKWELWSCHRNWIVTGPAGTGQQNWKRGTRPVELDWSNQTSTTGPAQADKCDQPWLALVTRLAQPDPSPLVFELYWSGCTGLVILVWLCWSSCVERKHWSACAGQVQFLWFHW